MSHLHSFVSKTTLDSDEKFSVFYHSLFDYPLTFSEIVKWLPKNYGKVKDIEIVNRDNFYFVKGKEGIIYKRNSHERVSKSKIEIARKASKVISIIPFVKMVGLTGSLAMNNAEENGDIDLMIITKSGKLWLTRVLVYSLLTIMNYKIRKPGQDNQKNKLCLNMWIDEESLSWPKRSRNIYTAHELLQIVPLINKGKTYEKFLNKNGWALDFWPNVCRVQNCKNSIKVTKPTKASILEKLSYRIQKQYMRNKITKEEITPKKAIFHPKDLSKEILNKIYS